MSANCYLAFPSYSGDIFLWWEGQESRYTAFFLAQLTAMLQSDWPVYLCV